jgi:site-specific recombinase XerC
MRGFKMEIDKFKEYLTGMTHSKFTISSILSDIQIFFKSYERLNTENVQKFILDQSKSGMDAKTVVRRVSSLRRYAKFSKRSIGELGMPRARRNVNKIQIISESDLIKIRNYIDKIDNADCFKQMRLKIIC